MVRTKSASKPTASLGCEAKLWLTADKLRNNMDAAEYKHVVLTRFTRPKGKTGGQFYTPSCVVRCLVEMLAPCKGRSYDPACGSGGKLGDISIYGQESNATTRRLAVMNLALRGIEADFGSEHADTVRRDPHPDLGANYVAVASRRVPPKGNASYAWIWSAGSKGRMRTGSLCWPDRPSRARSSRH